MYNDILANTRRWPNSGLMVDHRLRRLPNIGPILGQLPVFAEMFLTYVTTCSLFCSTAYKHLNMLHDALQHCVAYCSNIISDSDFIYLTQRKEEKM